MSQVAFKHLRLSMLEDVVFVEVMSKDVQGPERAKEFSEELCAVASEEWARPLLVDLHRTQYFSSMGLAALFKLVKMAKEYRRPVRYCNMHPDARVLADVAGLNLVVEIDDCAQTALEAFKQSAACQDYPIAYPPRDARRFECDDGLGLKP
jgi:anti-anti-sigma factor